MSSFYRYLEKSLNILKIISYLKNGNINIWWKIQVPTVISILINIDYKKNKRITLSKTTKNVYLYILPRAHIWKSFTSGQHNLTAPLNQKIKNLNYTVQIKLIKQQMIGTNIKLKV